MDNRYNYSLSQSWAYRHSNLDPWIQEANSHTCTLQDLPHQRCALGDWRWPFQLALPAVHWERGPLVTFLWNRSFSTSQGPEGSCFQGDDPQQHVDLSHTVFCVFVRLYVVQHHSVFLPLPILRIDLDLSRSHRNSDFHKCALFYTCKSEYIYIYIHIYIYKAEEIQWMD